MIPCDIIFAFSILTRSTKKNPDTLASEPDDGIRQFYGALVMFRDGARVAKLSLASDFSAVRLNGLPPNSTVASVVAMVAELDFTVPSTNVRKISPAHETPPTSSFILRMNDPSFAKKFCETAAAQSSPFTAVPTPADLPQSSGWCRVDCKKVLVSWYRSTRIARLNFGSEATARKVHQRFSAGEYTILDHAVQSSGPTCNRKHTVTLTDVPGLASAQDVRRSVPVFWEPRHVEVGKPSHLASDDVLFSTIRSHLDAVGPLEWWEAGRGAEGKRMKAKARFRDDADARIASSSLIEKPVTIYANTSI